MPPNLNVPDDGEATITLGAKPKKRIVLCVDGTWNAEHTNTNVWRISNMIPKRGKDGIKQVVIYERGVGARANNYTDIAHVGDAALGANIEDYILKAYRDLAAIYNDGDDVFMFGFSRGAYICLELADMISELGILARHAPITPELLYKVTNFGDPARKVTDYFGKDEEDLKKMEYDERFVAENLRNYSNVTRVKYMGIFDTVGAIVYKSKGHFRLYPSKSVVKGRHALAIDERRNKFVPDVWVMKADGQCQDDSFDFEQRWFCGNHSNVGGGYDYDYLPQFPLHWIMQGAITAGLDFVKITPLTGADCCDCPVRDELKDADNLFEDTIWKADEMFSKYFGSKSGWGKRTVGGEITHRTDRYRLLGETIDASVLYKMQYDESYQPDEVRNLKWMKCKPSWPSVDGGFCTRLASTGLPKTPVGGAMVASPSHCADITSGTPPTSMGKANKHQKPSYWASILRKAPFFGN
ncbi:hypothetical protein PBRA_001893 [Plasmodiophora brassicae]|nr:hypothetical protein PBRA_001893 [Plasmodiophora brassicae]